MSHRLSLSLFALYLLLIGIGQLLLLPPFEGYDETGHYSLIAQVAQEHAFPLDGNATISAQVKDYQQNGPMPYAVFEPYQDNGGLTYPAFFHNAPLREAYPQTFGQPDGKPFYEPTENRNWQIQHPPLYYLLMGKLLGQFPNTSFLDRFFILRLASYLLACAGLVIGMAGTLRYTNENLHPYITLAFFIYPALLPEIVPEFARLGNDSLCALIFGCAWTLCLRHARSGSGWGASLLLATLWSAALLTKAFFIATLGGWGLYLLFSWARQHHTKNTTTSTIRQLAATALPVMAGLGWYLFKYHQTGALVGHLEYKVALENTQNLGTALLSGISFLDVANNLTNFIMTWSWTGMASQLRLHELILLPMMITPIWLLVKGGRLSTDNTEREGQLLSLFLLIPFLAALAHHALILIIIGTKGGTPGWYLHIFMIPLTLLIAHGLRVLWSRRPARLALGGLTAYALLVTTAGRWAELAMTGGCAICDANKLFSFLMPSACLSVAPEIFQRISLWGHPATGLPLILAATLLIFVLIPLAWRQIPHIRKDFLGAGQDRACNAGLRR